MKNLSYLLIVLLSFLGCKSNTSDIENTTPKEHPFVWEAANVYFLLTDRFYNGNKTNDLVLERVKETAKLRGFMGGDLEGIIKKIKDGYFDKLGINYME